LTYVRACFLHCIRPPTPFTCLLSHSTGANPLSCAGPVLPSYSPILYKRKDLKKNMTFLFVCDIGSYTGHFLVVFPCVDVL
jgi:hypothetical protein